MFQLQVFKELAAYGEGMPPDFVAGSPVAEGEIIVGELPADVLQLIWARDSIGNKANAMMDEHAAVCTRDNRCVASHVTIGRLKVFHEVLTQLMWEAIHDAFGAETFTTHGSLGFRVGQDGKTVVVKYNLLQPDADKALDGLFGALLAGRHGGAVQLRRIRLG